MIFDIVLKPSLDFTSKFEVVGSLHIIAIDSFWLAFLIRLRGNSDGTAMVLSSLTFKPTSTLDASNDLTIVSLSTSNAVNDGFWHVSVFIIVTAGCLVAEAVIGSG